jgi:hypothetical protein
LSTPGQPDRINVLVAETIQREAAWLIENAEANVFPDSDRLFDQEWMRGWRARMVAQKARAGRIQLAVLLYAYSLEVDHPELVVDVRDSAGGWGSVANFIGDETALDYVGRERFERFRQNLQAFARETQILRTQRLPSPELDRATDRLFDEFF